MSSFLHRDTRAGEVRDALRLGAASLWTRQSSVLIATVLSECRCMMFHDNNLAGLRLHRGRPHQGAEASFAAEYRDAHEAVAEGRAHPRDQGSNLTIMMMICGCIKIVLVKFETRCAPVGQVRGQLLVGPHRHAAL